jgi:lipopolysaccharide/colanic/teichoic acid biosynthesis glycosyltransferase
LNQLRVDGLVLLGRGPPGQRLTGATGAPDRLVTAPVVAEQADARGRERLDVLGRNDLAGAELLHCLSEAAHVGGNDRQAVADRQREDARGIHAPPVRQYDDRCVRKHVLHLAVRQVAETPVDPLTYAELARELLQRLDGVERIAGDDQPHVRAIARHEWKRAEQQIDALVRADQTEEEERLPRPTAVADGSRALEDWMRNPHDPRAGHAELRELVGSAPRMHDDAVDGLEHPQQRLSSPGEHAGEVVRREDNRPFDADSAQPAQIRLGPDEPLHVDDVGREAIEPPAGAPHGRAVFDGFQRQPRPRARGPSEERRAERKEKLFAPVTGRFRRLAEAERRGQERDFVAARGKRCGEPVVVRRRVRSCIDECHAHRPMVARAIKRIADPILAFFLLLLFSPVLLAIVVWILLDTGRPVLYTQVRAGKDARPFRMLKFRTMVRDAVERGRAEGLSEDPYGIVPDDPRITSSGRFLRRTSLDELPQLVHVLLGQMSLVGPRPDLVEQVANYDEQDRRRLEVRPGITGWSQVQGRDEIPWPERFEQDAWYVENWSLGLDLKILLRTLTQPFREEPVPVEDTMNIERARRASSAPRP